MLKKMLKDSCQGLRCLRKIGWILIPLLSIWLVPMRAQTVTGSGTLFVAPSPAPTTSGPGSCETPNFNTIQAAIIAAAPGDMVIVCNGTYVTGQITINKALTLKAANIPSSLSTPRNVIVQGTPRTLYTIFIPGSTTASNITIEGLDLSNPKTTNLNTDVAGIQVGGSASSGASNLVFRNNWLHLPRNPTVPDCGFTGAFGISMNFVKDVTIESNKIFDIDNDLCTKGFTSKARGILVKIRDGGGVVQIKNNILTNIKGERAIGINVTNTVFPTPGGTFLVADNSISGLADHGVTTGTFTKLGTFGIELDGVKDNNPLDDVRGNTIDGAAMAVRLAATQNFRVTGNVYTNLVTGGFAQFGLGLTPFNGFLNASTGNFLCGNADDPNGVYFADPSSTGNEFLGGSVFSGNTSCAVDIIPPSCTISSPANITVNTEPGQCSAVVTYTVTATGNPAPTVVCTPASGSAFPLGTSTVTCTATNSAGSASCSFTVTVIDNTPPVPNVATLPTVTGECSATISSAPTATDNCAGTITGTTSDPLTYTSQGTFTVTWTYNDGNGNSSTQTQTVIVKDVTPPSITCPQSITVIEAISNGVPQGSAVVNYTVTAADNCPGVTVACSVPSGSSFPVGTTTVTCTATDAGGNRTSCTFNVTVRKIVCYTVVSVDANFTGKGWKGAKQVPVQNAKVIMLPKGPVQANVQNLLDAKSVWANLSTINGIGDPVLMTGADGKVMVVSTMADPNGWAIYLDLKNAIGVGVVAPAITAGNTEIAVANTDCAPQKNFTVKLESDGVTTTATFNRQGNISGSLAGSGEEAEVEVEAQIPTEHALHNAYPNPFNPSTTITYDVPEPSFVTLTVYDMLGRVVASLVQGEKEPGQYRVQFNASSLTSGMYLYRLQAGKFTQTKKMILMR